MTLAPDEVFTPGAFPEHTYVDRSKEQYEYRLLRHALADGILPSVAGPSKSGKTVLAEKVLGDRWVRVSGAEVATSDELWLHVLSELDIPIQESTSTSRTQESSAEGSVEGEAGIPIVAKGKAGARAGMVSSRGSEAGKVYAPAGMRAAIEALNDDDRILVLDDFHYVPPETRREIAQQLKEGLARGLNAVVLAVPHRGDDPIRSNPDLRGRVASIDIGHWDRESLGKIGRLGFPKVGLRLSDGDLELLARESLGSPQLMQALCLETAYHYENQLSKDDGEPNDITLGREGLHVVARLVADLTDATTAFQILSAGPKSHGKERTKFKAKGGGEADNYGLILRAIAEDPPQSSFTYEQLQRRVTSVCMNEPPPMDRITRSLGYLEDLMDEKIPDDRVIAWDPEKSVLDIVDPHFLFFLRWKSKAGRQF